MNFNTDEIRTLLTDIDQYRRRTVADYTDSLRVNYIESKNECSLLQTPNNHIIYARRGCGKTTLLLNAKAVSQNNYSVLIECQKDEYNYMSQYDVLLNLLLDSFEKLSSELQNEQKKLRKQYISLKSCKFSPVKFFRKKSSYSNMLKIINLIKNRLNKLIEQEEYTYVVDLNYKESNVYNSSEKYAFDVDSHSKMSLSPSLQNSFMELDTGLNVSGKAHTEASNSFLKETTTNTSGTKEITIKKSELIIKLKKLLISFYSDFKETFEKSIFYYLDDFYQIKKEYHPYLIHFLHDISKSATNRSFCFNLVALPNSLKINFDNHTTFSLKDDFSIVKMDFSLSNMNELKNQLFTITEKIQSSQQIKKEDFNNFFNNEDTINYLIMATGGIPRDFMSGLSYAITLASQTESKNIDKDIIFEIVKSLRDDKENNFEKDSDLPKEIINKAVDMIKTEVVEGLKTNIILYPIELITGNHEIILNNLINLTYLHVIKDSITSENNKKKCRAFLIDMTFWGTTRKTPGFDIRTFWKKAEKSRLSVISQSKVWNFSESDIELLFH